MQSPRDPEREIVGKRSARREQAQHDPEQHETACGGPHIAAHPG